ncbi:MAG: hypothetical protein MUP36_03085, partial [Demequinaceae bacterium]|nr:hypothetical protein [Demequinaceae bacterium]
TLPSAGELLHWEELHSPPSDTGPVGFPEAKAPTIGPDGSPIEPELTRFLPRPQPGRYVVAAVVTACAFIAVGATVTLMAGASGPKGVGVFFAVIGAVVAGVVIVVWVWRWAGRRRSGIPIKRSNPAEVQGGRLSP